MEDMNREEFGRMLKETFRTVFFAVLIFAGMVIWIFQSEAYKWQRQRERAEKEERAKAERILNTVEISAWVNGWDKFGVTEERSLKKLTAGVEYYVGALREFDRNDELNFNRVIWQTGDDIRFHDPILMLKYANTIYAKSSLDGTGGWIVSGPNAKGSKTGTYLNYPEPETVGENSECWGEGTLLVKLPVNGADGLEVNVTDPTVSEAMREYNYFVDQRLDDIYRGVREPYASRTRRVWVSHLIVKAYPGDPRKKGAVTVYPEAVLTLRVRSYGQWDLTREEYYDLCVTADNLSERYDPKLDFAPHVTIELLK